MSSNTFTQTVDVELNVTEVLDEISIGDIAQHYQADELFEAIADELSTNDLWEALNNAADFNDDDDLAEAMWEAISKEVPDDKLAAEVRTRSDLVSQLTPKAPALTYQGFGEGVSILRDESRGRAIVMPDNDQWAVKYKPHDGSELVVYRAPTEEAAMHLVNSLHAFEWQAVPA